MKIIVLNGSPKGDVSVTMQYIHFLQKQFPQHEFKISNVTHRIKKLEKDDQAFQEILDGVKESDGVLWAFPLYVFLVHADYKRFIELIWERGAQAAFQDKYVAALSTSIHFYDHTAHNYMQAICDDLSMKYVDGYSAHMEDLTKAEERKRLLLFAENFFETITNKLPTFKTYQPVVSQAFDYIPGEIGQKIDAGGKKVLILTNAKNEQSNEWKMVEQVRKAFAQEVEVVNINALDIKGSCMGCIHCGYNNTCVWEGKDEFVPFFKTKFRTADILLFAGTIHDRYLSSRWKTFYDRGFFNGHTPTITNKQVGWIISGSLNQNANLRQILEAMAELGGANLVDVVTDECGNSVELDARLHMLATNLARFAAKQYVMPPTFLTVAGAKIFRDGLWGGMRAIFKADHKFYKEHGYYDFPHKQYAMRLISVLTTVLFKIPSIRKRFYTQEIKPGMIRGLQKVVAQA